MARRSWPAAEMEVLERHANRSDWLAVVQQLMPDRSVAALRSRMQKVRETAAPMSKWQREAIGATQQLGEATLRVGVWS